jgi:serine/threonine protein kinase/tetratricopeptide (TPR) repeat protein
MTSQPWRQIEEIYHAALERDASQRESFLRDACRDDEPMRREVESLLANESKAAGFLSEPALGVAAKMSESPDSSMVGQQIGAYQIVSLLGAGGMGEVYRARDAKLGRDVAIKILPRIFTADPDRIVRFQREARMLASLNHPHIGAIYGLEDADGVCALVLELVDGETLADRIARGPIALTETLNIARQIADALDATHAKGIVHRDLKPANIKITSDDVVKILDFGLANVASGDGAHQGLTQSPTVTVGGTREGVILGTVAYMSPEQARGRPVDKRTDIWAFGCVLYEMLTGRTAFAGETLSDSIAAILERAPDWSALPADIPPRVRHLVERCLEKNSKHRLRDIGDAAAELAQPMVGESFRVTTLPGLRELARQSARQPSRTTHDAAVAIAVLPFSDMSSARDQQHLCEGMAEEIMNALVHITGIRVASRTSAFLARQHAGELAAIGRALSVGHVLEGSVRTSGGRLRVTAQLTDVASGYQLWSECFDRNAQDIFAVQDEIAAGVVAAVRVRLATRRPVVPPRPQVKNLEAYDSYLKARHLRYTKSDHRGALRCYQQAVELDPSHAPSWVGLAEVTSLSSIYSLASARDAYATAKAALATAATEHGESAEARYVEGTIAFGERDWTACERALLRALELAPDDVRALCWFARLLVARGRLDEARPILQRAREVDPLAPYPYATTGFCLLAAGRPAESERYLEQALTFDSDNSLALWSRGVARIALGHPEDAVAPLERVSAATQRSGHYHAVLGWALAAAGRVDEARSVLDAIRARPTPAPPIVAEAWLLASLGDRDAAFEVLDRAAAESQAFMAFPGMPGFGPLRGDPRFAALMERLGLPTSVVSPE